MSSSTLSERESKRIVAGVGVPVADERAARTADDAVSAAAAIGGPVVVKLCGDRIAHKTERGLVRLRLDGAEPVRNAADELLGAATPDDGDVELLVAPMINGTRELIAGVVHDHQFGPNVMLGIGGILAEALGDVVFRPAPLSAADAEEMIDQLRTQRLLGEFRGESALDRAQLRTVLLGLSRLATERADIVSVDINPLILRTDGSLVAVDALVELGSTDVGRPSDPGPRFEEAQFRAMFEPDAVVVAGASSHPGKFGFVSTHNIRVSGFRGPVYGTNLTGEEVLDIPTFADPADLPDGIDLAMVCTPAPANETLLGALADRGVRAAFVASAGYGEAGESGRAAERRLVDIARDRGVLLAGPNGQGLVSTPARLCAQIVAPMPPDGGIAVASQSGNFVSTFLNYARQTGVGVSRAVSAGNAAMVGPADYVQWFATDPATTVALTYVEGITDGRDMLARLAWAAERKPVVLVKGGSTAGGARAAASHTGALAADDTIFDGACRQANVTRAATVEEAFEVAATFATQPLPRGPRVLILTTVGGWGVVTSDQLASVGDLELMPLPDDLAAGIDELLPPRWSRNNPIDCAGGETRDTIPTLLDLVCAHPDVDSVVYLGLGIQSNQARMMREGHYYPAYGLDRIADFHERQDARYATAAAECSERWDKPVLMCTELAVADPANAGVAAVRATGRLCYPSGNRAVIALAHCYRYAKRRQRRN